MNWLIMAMGLFAMVMSWQATHVSSTAMAGGKPLYPIPKRARIMIFLVGLVLFAHGLARLLG